MPYRSLWQIGKENKVKTVNTIIVPVLILSFLTGCGGPKEQKKPAVETGKGKVLFTVDFEQGKVLRYKFVSNRTTEILLAGSTDDQKNKANKYTESMEMVMAYNPVKVNAYGLSTIEAKCESMKITKNLPTGARKDAAENFAGKTFTFTVGPSGKITDYSRMEALINETAEKAFRENSTQGRIKEPDMVNDFLATQWFLWDSISSIPHPSEGAAVGQIWKSQLSIPISLIMHQARDVEYKLQEIRDSQNGKIAVIDSTFSLSKSSPQGWRIPYRDSFQMSGPFGFYVNCRGSDLQGKGQELFNIDAGKSLGYEQSYKMTVTAALMIPLGGISPKITIDQKLSMQLLDDTEKGASQTVGGK